MNPTMSPRTKQKQELDVGIICPHCYEMLVVTISSLISSKFTATRVHTSTSHHTYVQ